VNGFVMESMNVGKARQWQTKFDTEETNFGSEKKLKERPNKIVTVYVDFGNSVKLRIDIEESSLITIRDFTKMAETEFEQRTKSKIEILCLIHNRTHFLSQTECISDFGHFRTLRLAALTSNFKSYYYSFLI
jgi:hypothetical protein